MIQVETERPVYSNASGKLKEKIKSISGNIKEKRGERKELRKSSVNRQERIAKRDSRKSTRIENRAIRKANRKAKRNARKLERKNTPKGEKFTFKLSKIFKKDKKSEKKNQDGSVSVVPEKSIVTTPTGSYDKIEVSKATGVTPEQVTPEFIAKNSVTTPSGEVSVIVPDSLVGQDSQGDTYLAEDLQDENEKQKDVNDDDNKKRGLSTTQKVLLFGGIGVAVIVVGVILYRKLSNKGK
jgi:hypothetical protein